MIPSTYIISVPLGLIAIASFAVRQQDHSFQSSQRTAEIQSVPTPFIATGPQVADEPSQRLDHERYGVRDSATGGALLGRDAAPRPLGERGTTPPDWLGTHPGKESRKKPLPDIAGFEETPPPRDPLAEPVSSESGYQITAEEVTRLDMETGRVIFNKNVRMVSPQFNLTCDQLVVHLGKDKNSMERSEARGSVNILLTGVPPEKTYRGQSGAAVFDPRNNQIVLSDWPKVKGISQEQVAAEASTRMTLFTKTGRLLTEGRAQTRVAKSFLTESASASK